MMHQIELGRSVVSPPYRPAMAVRAQPALVVRPEHDEWALLEDHAELYEAALIKEDYAAPYPQGHPHCGRDETRLMRAVPREREVWRDPATAGLVSRVTEGLPATSRWHRTPLAGQVGFPLDVVELASDQALCDLAVDLSLEAQAGAATRIPPYFDVDRRGGRAVGVNLRMLRRTVAAVADEVPTAVVQVTAHRLRTGVARAVAPDYALTGVRRVLLRVRGFGAQTADRDTLGAFLDAIDAFEERDVETYPDCVGVLGPVFVAAGASGFTTGTRFFSSVPQPLFSLGGGGGARPIGVHDAGAWEERPRDPGDDAHSARIKNLARWRDLMLLASRDPDALISSLRQGGPRQAVWAALLAERCRRVA